MYLKFRFSISTAFLSLIPLCSLSCSAETAEGKGDSIEQQKPHIILVMADDQGYGDAGYTGHPVVQTPHMDEMAKNSLVFSRFYAGAPVCSPTRASVLTGRSPMRTNVVNHGHYMRPHEITIAEALKTNGYKTAHFGKWHIGSVQAESPTSPGQQGFDEWLTALNFYDQDPYMSHNGIYKQLKGQGSVITMDAAIDYLKKNASSGAPTFTVIWFPSPHDPHKEVSSNSQLYKGEKHAGYFQEITLLDEQLGKLRKSLRDLKIADDTLLLYCSDNGGLVKETSGGRNKKGSIYEGGLRVPAILEWPAKYQHKVISTPVSTSDIYPTLLAITGTEIKKQPMMDGMNLQPILSGAEKIRSNTIGFWHLFEGGQATFSDKVIRQLMEAQQTGKATPFPERLLKNANVFPTHQTQNMELHPGHAALLDWPYKIHSIRRGKKGKVTYELYNIETDPMETNDISKEEVKVFSRIQKQLHDWQRSVMKSLNGNDYR